MGLRWGLRLRHRRDEDHNTKSHAELFNVLWFRETEDLQSTQPRKPPRKAASDGF